MIEISDHLMLNLNFCNTLFLSAVNVSYIIKCFLSLILRIIYRLHDLITDVLAVRRVRFPVLGAWRDILAHSTEKIASTMFL